MLARLIWLSSRTPDPSIVIRQAIGRTIRDSRAGLAHNNIATSHNADLDRSRPPVERHGRMKRPNRIRREDISLVTSNLHRDCRRAGKQRGEEDLILYDDIRTRGWLPGSVSCGSVAGTGGGGGETIPEVELLFRDSRLAGLVGLYVVRE